MSEDLSVNDEAGSADERRGGIDQELLDMLRQAPAEDPILTEYGAASGGDVEGEGMELTEGFFPEAENWKGKTVITPEQVQGLAATRRLCKIFPELASDKGHYGAVDTFIDQLLTDYEQYSTSMGGESRKELSSILRSMFGGPADEQLAERSGILQLFRGDLNDEDD